MQVSHKKGLETEKTLISQLWFKYFPYWPIFLIFLVLAGAGAILYLRYKTPLYESTASILIKDEKKGEEDSKMMETLNVLSSKKIIENEMEVLKSRALMVGVVKKLHLYARIYQKTKVRSVSVYNTSPITVESINPDSLNETKDKVFFNYDNVNKQVIINNKPYPLSKWVNTQYGVLRFTPNNLQGANKNPLYFVLINPKKAALSYIDRLDVSPASKLSSVLNLKIKDEEPKCSEDILNNLIIEYNKAYADDKNSLAAKTLKFVDDRLRYVSHDLDSIQKKLQQYKTDNTAIDISSQGNLFLQNVSQVDHKLSEVNMQLSQLNQVENYVKSKDNSTGLVPSTVGVSDPMLSGLVAKLYDTELQYEKMKKNTPENNPLMIQLTQQIEKIKPSILENIQNQKASLEASKNNLYATNNHFSSVLQSLPQKERDLIEISREQNVKSGIYNFLLQKREEAELSLRAAVTDNRVVDKAQSSFSPVSPNGMMIYAIAGLLGLLLSVGVVSIREIFKRTILFRHEIEAYTAVPVIGEIAFENSKESLVIGNGKRTFIAEQFRNLRTSLPYTGINKEKKRLLVTSTISGEGKSFIVANLGVSLALAGKKVVVLEFDLSNPTLSNKLNMTANKGLTDYLMNDDVEPEEIIWRTAVQKDLFIIPAAGLPENPSELIMSERVQGLLDYLSDIFDYIIIDTAPVGLLSDAYVISKYCDATLYVVRHRHTRKVFIQRLDENNKINELKNMAIVFNGVKPRGFGKNGYGYGYGYGYIYNEKKKRSPTKIK